MQKFMKALAAIMLALAVVCTACTKDPENGGNNGGNGNGGSGGSGGSNGGGGSSGGGTTEGVYLGIIGFNDDLKTKTIGLLNANTEYAYTNFISTLDMRDGTVLYHADYKALDWLQNASLPDQLINVSLVTFTDGLDNGSTMLNSSYSTPAAYLDDVSLRIRNDRVGGKPINAYAIGLRGNDVTDNASFQQNLQKLSNNPSNSSVPNYYEVENWDAVKERFRQIAIQLYNETTVVNAEVKIPGGKPDGTVIRITFDNVNNANASLQYIQGTYYRENGQGKLKNVSYHGLQSTSGIEVVSVRQEGIFYWYSFAELKLPNGNPLANTSNMKMWYYLDNSQWQPESEFTPESYTDINVNRKSAVAVLVLDCSSSLGSNFANMKEAAIEFVQLLNDYGNSDNGGGNSGGGGNGGGETDQYYQVSVSATAGGTATGGGSFLEGSTCTVSATPNTNYTFANWTENGSVVSSLQNHSFTVTGNRSLVANFTYNGGGGGGGNAPTGAISGKFTINANGDQVWFSQGNLQYQASTQKWQFAANQYDYIGNNNSNVSSSYSGWIDLFGWGTSGWNSGFTTYYHPWDSNNSNGSMYGPSGTYNLTGSYANADWGVYNAISNGGNQAGQWRTLTGGSGEWYYIFNTRNTSSGIRYAKAQVAGVNGVILLPDNWSASTYGLSNTNTSGASFSSNVITASQWLTLENAGAVFLPAAGVRVGTSVDFVGSHGNYWSASYYDSYYAYYVNFGGGSLRDFFNVRYYGFSVRLVRACQ